METLIALFTSLAATKFKQAALISALVKKGVISYDEIDAELPPSDDEMKKKLDLLTEDFVGLIKNLEESGRNTPDAPDAK